MSIQTLRIDSDNLLTVDGLYDNVAAEYANSATVQVTLLDPSGAEVSGVTWPLALTYVPSSSGRYRVVLPDALQLQNFQSYTAVITADAGADALRTWYMPVRVVRDG